MIRHFLGIDDARWEQIPSLFTESPILPLESWQYFHLLDRFRLLVPHLFSSSILGALNNEIDTEQELSWFRGKERSQVAGYVTFFHFAFASYPRFLEWITSFLEETIQHKLLTGAVHKTTASSQEKYSSLCHDLDILITAMQKQSHSRREKVFALHTYKEHKT